MTKTCVGWMLAAGLSLGVLLAADAANAGQDQDHPPAAVVTKGLRVFTCGHSFHFFVPPILEEMAKNAGFTEHTGVGLSAIGASRVIQHWNVHDDQNKAKSALREGNVDVLTLSPLYPPDDGIMNFAKLALEHNPNIRITVQESWMPYDLYQPTFPNCDKPAKVDHNALTGPELWKLHDPYFKSMDAYIRDVNKSLGKTVLRIVPAGQAVIALREKIIAGQVPGLKTQEELFSDPLGHPQPPLKVLVSYCHFAVIYQRSPVGLPLPAILATAGKPNWDEKLNRLLQDIAWDAVTHHPLSGVTAATKP